MPYRANVIARCDKQIPRDGFPACSPQAMIEPLGNSSSQQAAIGPVKLNHPEETP
jgi:hypothetical protein